MKKALSLLGTLFHRRLFTILWIEWILFSFLTGAFFSPVKESQTEDFFAEKEDLVLALEEAREDFLALAPESDQSMARQKVLFFETALRFELNVWHSPFESDAASVYAELMREWEILLASSDTEKSPRSLELEQEEACLSQILKQKSLPDYLSFLENRYRKNASLSEEAIQRRLEEDWLTLSSDQTPGAQDLFYKIRLLRQSLNEKVNRYDPAREKEVLSPSQEKRLERILSVLLHRYEAGAFDPVSANTQTLYQSEELFVFLFLLLLFYTLFLLKKESASEKEALFTLGLFSLISLLLLSLSLCITTVFSAKGSLLPLFFFIFGQRITISFFPALLFRLFLRLLPGWIPLFLSSFLLYRKKKAGLALLPLAGTLLFLPLSFVARLFGHNSTWIYCLPFPYLDPAAAFLWEERVSLATATSPVPGILLLLLISFFLLWDIIFQKKGTA